MTRLQTEVERAHNFNPGPAVLPLPVLERVQQEFMDFRGKGTSILEVSHRSDAFEGLVRECQNRVRDLLGIPGNYHVLFLQGGASLQYPMIPMNLVPGDELIQVVNSGRWSGKKITELDIQNFNYEVVASSEDTDFDRIPEWDDSLLDPEAAYLHICSNETVNGVQWQEYPDTGRVPLVADMSSDIMSRSFEAEKFGLFYAGAQKNMGPAGITVVVVRDDLTDRTPDRIPTILRYDSHIQKNSIYNTPPAFAIYVMDMVLEWVQDQGGLPVMERRSREKSRKIYEVIDGSDLYEGTARRESRSRMNVTFRITPPDLEEEFLEGTRERNMIGLAGHRSVGGCRVSLYNSLPMESVDALVEYMKEFAHKHA